MSKKVRKRRFKKQSYKKLLKVSNDVGLAFSDDVFKCEDKSVAISSQYKTQLDCGKIIWKRPKEITDIPHFLYREKLGPAQQVEFVGNGPNEWFIAASIAIASDRNLLYKVIPKSQIHFLRGILKFNFWHFGQWTKVVIDDKLPIGFNDELIFSRSRCKLVYWVPLLEKAYAKLYGNYETMAIKGSLNSVLMDMTGAIVETIPILNDGKQREQFRLLSEELDKKAIICAKSKDSNSFQTNTYGLHNNRIYVIKNIKKPSSGTFRKTFSKDNNKDMASIRVLNTIADQKKSSQSHSQIETLQDIWLSNEEFCKYFESITICRTYATERESVAIGQSNCQFCFDVLQECGEVMIDLMQKNSNQFIALGFKLYKVEINRDYKIHNLSRIPVIFTADSLKIRNVFKRIELNFGRYVLIANFSNPDIELVLRIYTTRPSNLKILSQDMPRKNLLPFVSPKYPKYVTRIVIKSANGLEKQDRFGSANPYCVIKCGRKVVKSFPLHETLNPEWNNFSAIFYHEKLVSISIEIWHNSLLIDYFIGKVEVIPKITGVNDLNTIQELELCGRKEGHKRPGIIKLEVYTYEDLRAF